MVEHPRQIIRSSGEALLDQAGWNKISCPVRGHTAPVWDHYSKVDDILMEKGAMRKGLFGHAETRVCETVQMTELLSAMLRIEPDLFLDDTPIQPQRFSAIL